MISRFKPHTLIALAGLSIAAVVPPISTPASALDDAEEKFFANIAGPGTREIEVGVNRWSTEDERRQLLTILTEKGQEDLVEALRKQKETGYVRVQGGQYPSSPLRYSRQGKTKDGKRYILVVTDRPVGYGEAERRPTELGEYSLTVIELMIDENGKGEGAIAPAAKVRIDKETNQLALDTFQTTPTRLLNVRKMK